MRRGGQSKQEQLARRPPGSHATACLPARLLARREVVEALVRRGDAAAVGRLCVAAVQMGPEEAEAVRRIAVALLEGGAAGVDAAVTVASAFWEQAGLVGAPEPAEDKGAAATLQAAAESELTAGTAALALEPAGPGASAAAKQLLGRASPAEAQPAASALAEPTTEPTAAELRQAAAIVLAAAVVEVAQHGRTGPLVDVTERLLAEGQAELVAMLVAAMVEAGEHEQGQRCLQDSSPLPGQSCLNPAPAAALLGFWPSLPVPAGHSAEAGAISVAALSAGKPRVVEALAGEACCPGRQSHRLTALPSGQRPAGQQP